MILPETESQEKQTISITKKRNSKPCPEKLEKLLYNLNLINPNEDIWYLDIGSRKLLENKDLHLEALEGLKKRIEKFSSEFQHFIFGREVDCSVFSDSALTFLPDLDYWETYEALKRYEDFFENRRLLKSIVENYSNWIKKKMPYLIQPKARISLDEKGKIQFSFDEFIEALQGVEISRLKICENCSRIFWQGRNNQKGCSIKCANNIRVKKSRSLKREKRVEYEHNSFKKNYQKK